MIGHSLLKEVDTGKTHSGRKKLFARDERLGIILEFQLMKLPMIFDLVNGVITNMAMEFAVKGSLKVRPLFLLTILKFFSE
jgi:hypothetical protein